MVQVKQSFWAQLFIIHTRLILGGGFVFASIIKIKGRRFTTGSHEDAAFGSAMHFFETMYHTGIYWQFLGWSQLMAGLLLMTQRYAKLGAVVSFPIILNIFMITVSMDFGFTPFITGLMLAANITLLAWHWNELRSLLGHASTPDLPFLIENEKIWEITGMVLFMFTATYRMLYDEYNLFLWFG